jgi:hypothetical protein
MMRRYVHVGINPQGGGTIFNQPINWNARIEALLVQYGDFYRYANQNYVLFTDANLAYLSNAIRALPGFQGVYVLLTEMTALDTLRCNGWMDPRFWQWLQGQHNF